MQNRAINERQADGSKLITVHDMLGRESDQEAEDAQGQTTSRSSDGPLFDEMQVS